MLIQIELQRFWLDFKCEGTFDYGVDVMAFEATDLTAADREVLRQVFTNEGKIWTGMNNPAAPHAVHVVIDGVKFEHFRWNNMRHDNLFTIKGTYGYNS